MNSDIADCDRALNNISEHSTDSYLSNYNFRLTRDNNVWVRGYGAGATSWCVSGFLKCF